VRLPAIGASAGVFGLLVSYALLFPRRRVILLFPPVPMPAWLFATGYGALELLLGIAGAQNGVAHFAHVGGMLGAATLLLHWMRRRREQRLG
jgi:membrane associated rhomboid family serine protease